MRVNKRINYNFKQDVLNAGHTLLPNQCFQNCMTSINFDRDKQFALGFSTVNGTNFSSFHGWLEDKNTIYEVTQPQKGGIEYYKAFSLTYRQLQKYFPIQSLDILCDHRHFMLSYCKTHNHIIKIGYNYTLDGMLSPCILTFRQKIIAIIGHLERKITLI